MTDMSNTPPPKTFWQKPEGKTGTLFLLGIFGALGYVLWKFGATILAFVGTTIGLVLSLAVLGLLIYMAFQRLERL